MSLRTIEVASSYSDSEAYQQNQYQILMNHYNKLYSAEDSVVVFIDHQPQMTFGVANADRATLISNVTLLAKVAKEFEVQRHRAQGVADLMGDLRRELPDCCQFFRQDHLLFSRT